MHVVVVDLQQLLGLSPADPETVARFTFAKPMALRFWADGTSLAVCAKDGHAVHVLQLRPAPRVLRRLSGQALADAQSRAGTKDTSGVVEPSAHLDEFGPAHAHATTRADGGGRGGYGVGT